MKNIRESNFELLRLVCMLFIVLHHFIQAVYINYPSYFENRFTDPSPIILTFFGTFALVGVNVFVLISGYFSIRPKWSNFWPFYIQLAFYAFVFYILHMILDGVPLNRWLVYYTIMPISHNQGLWFVPTYFGLYLLSPLLNKALDNMSKRELLYFIVFLSVINLWFGFFCQLKEMNNTGYNLMNFVYLYVIGRLIKVLNLESKNEKIVMGGGINLLFWLYSIVYFRISGRKRNLGKSFHLLLGIL